MTVNQKIIIGVLLFLVWGILVAQNLAPVTDFVGFIKATLFSLGLTHVASSGGPK